MNSRKSAALFLSTALALMALAVLPRTARGEAGASFTRVSIPKEGKIALDREFHMNVTFQCRDLTAGDRVMLDYISPEHPGIRPGYLGHVYYFDIPPGAGGGNFTGEHVFETLTFLSDRGPGPKTVNLYLDLWKRDPATGGFRSDRRLAWHTITLTAVPAPVLSVSWTLSDPAGTVVLMKDSISTSATVRYTNLLPDSQITVKVLGYTGAIPDLKEKTELARWVSPPQAAGNGTVSTPALVLKPPDKPANFNWHIVAQAEAKQADSATGPSADYQAVNFAEVEVEFTQLDYVKPPDTITVDEEVPIVIGISYKHVLGAPYLVAVIYDRDEDAQLAKVDMPDPAGYSGEYVFPALRVKPTRTGTWKLAARIRVKNLGDLLGLKQFEMKVVDR